MSDPRDPNTPTDPSTGGEPVPTNGEQHPDVAASPPSESTDPSAAAEAPAAAEPQAPTEPQASGQQPAPPYAAPAGGAPSGYPTAPFPAGAAYPGSAYPGNAYPGAAQPGAGYPGATDAPPLVQPYPGAPPAAYGVGTMAPPVGAAVPPPGSRPKTLAIIALVAAGIGLIMAFIPFVTWFSGLFLLTGFVLAIIALVKKTQGGKGLGIAALVISVVGWIVSIVVTIASFAIIADAANESLDEGSIAPAPTASAPADDEVVAGAAQELAVIEVAFGRTSYDPSTWWYVVILENPNEDYVFDFATIDIEAIAADGTILDTASEYPTLLSGTTALASVFTAVGEGEIAELNVRGPLASEAIASPFEETGAFYLDALSATSDDYSTTVTGTVSGDFATDQELVSVVVVARAPDGRILGGEYTYVDRVPSDGTAVQFQALFYDLLPADTVFEAYPSL